MGMRDFFTKNKDVKNYIKEGNKLKNWESDLNQSVVVQKNILIFLLVVSFVIIFFSLLTIRYLKKTEEIKPFVIEIDQKTGVPTVVEPLSVKVYSSQEAIKRYFVMKYIRAREEYFYSTFKRNFSDIIRVLSTAKSYYNDYRPKFNTNNPASPYNIYGVDTYRTITLKSIIFPSDNSAQVRLSINVKGRINTTMNKIVFMEFDFKNLNMNDEDRLINPLGFQVSLFRMNDENS